MTKNSLPGIISYLSIDIRLQTYAEEIDEGKTWLNRDDRTKSGRNSSFGLCSQF